MRTFLSAALLCSLAAAPALAEESGPLRLLCRADNPALLAQPLAFSIDLATRQAREEASGTKYGVTAYRDGFGLWEQESGPTALVFRIDRLTGRFARVDTQRLEGVCERGAGKR